MRQLWMILAVRGTSGMGHHPAAALSRLAAGSPHRRQDHTRLQTRVGNKTVAFADDYASRRAYPGGLRR
jgi:hypothetical protein